MSLHASRVCVLSMLIGALPMLACSSATTPAATPTTAQQKYSAPDGSASVQLPAGWKVLQAANGVIQASGPLGELASLGTTLQVHNGPLQLSTSQLNLPSQDSLPQKLNAMVVLGKQDPAASATGNVQNTLISQAAIKVPATVGQCGRFLFSSTGSGAASTDSEAVFCSTPVNAAGNYNLIYVGVTVPAAQAQQARPALELVARELKLEIKCGAEFEFFLFRETGATLRQKGFRNLTTLSPGMFGYSWVRTSESAALVHALLDGLNAFGIPIEGFHTETGPGVFEAAIGYEFPLGAGTR